MFTLRVITANMRRACDSTQIPLWCDFKAELSSLRDMIPKPGKNNSQALVCISTFLQYSMASCIARKKATRFTFFDAPMTAADARPSCGNLAWQKICQWSEQGRGLAGSEENLVCFRIACWTFSPQTFYLAFDSKLFKNILWQTIARSKQSNVVGAQSR